MKPTTETNLLKAKEIEPTDQALEKILGNELFPVYREVINTLTDEFGLETQWQFYKDGGAWLCKVVFKKKSILLISIWEYYINTGFYFTDKTGVGVLDLDIDKEIKAEFEVAKPIGKLLPLILDIDQLNQIKDLKEIVRYKKALK